MGRGGIAQTVAGILALATAFAHAEVLEEHVHQPYPVPIQPGQTLRQALHAATPILVDGRRFHGYTHWNVHWNFWWHSEASGRCRITRVTTRLRTRIQMPELHAGSPAQQAQFARYARALHQHEQGHVQFGRSAAQAIDRGIAALPEVMRKFGVPQVETEAAELLRQRISALGYVIVGSKPEEFAA